MFWEGKHFLRVPMSATLSVMCELLEMSFSGSVEDLSSIFISLWLNTVSFSDLTNTRTLQVLSPFVSAFLLGYNLFRSFYFCFFFFAFFVLGFVFVSFHVWIMNKISCIKLQYRNHYPTLKLKKKKKAFKFRNSLFLVCILDWIFSCKVYTYWYGQWPK